MAKTNEEPLDSLDWDDLVSSTPSARLVEVLNAKEPRRAAARSYVARARTRVRAMHTAGASGIRVVDEWTRCVDHLVVALYAVNAAELTTANSGVALFALGGYGRAELSPHSDLDLLIVHPGADGMSSFVEGILYPLWDAGLDVQCVARTVEQNVAVAQSDVRSRTSLLESRFLAGDRGVLERHEQEVIAREILGRDVKPFLETKLAEMEARHRRYGDTVYVLEPNVKEGQGGLRDIHTALWVAKVRFKAQSAEELLQWGVIPPGEIEALQSSRDFLLRVRNHLHFLARRREDRLTFDLQDEAAPFFGFEDDGPIPAVERFLQSYYDTANRVGHFAGAVIRRATAGLLPVPAAARTANREVMPGVSIQAGEVYLNPRAVRRHPLTLLAAFEAAQIQGVELSPQALGVVRDSLDLVDDRFRRDPAAVEMFFRILRNPRRVATTLMRMHDVRFLDRFIPEFGRIFGRVQRDLYHAYPVDVHSLFAVQELRRLARGEYEAEFPTLTSLLRDLRRPDILYLATLLHDVGKGVGHSHAERGAEMALSVGDRMGLAPQDLEYLVFLVENHLLLSHTAQGRDLNDEDLIVEFAGKVRELEILKMLYLLTVADIRAVGPGAWTSWKNLLFRELYEKARHVLETGSFGRELAAERVVEVGQRLEKAAEGLVPSGEVQSFLAQVDHPQYLLTNPIEALIRHLGVFARRSESPVVELRPVAEEGYTEVLLLTRDRPGLFAEVAGLMAGHRLNILSAVLNTRKDDWVLDVFHVSGPPGDPSIGEDRWREWQRDLKAVLSGEKTLEQTVGSRLRRRPGLARPKPKVPTRITVDNAASRRFTVVDVRAGDRLGLLYDVARTFAEHGLNIRLSKITTNIDQVADSFYIEQIGGGKVTDPSAISRLEEALETVIASQAPEGKEA